MGFFDLFRRKGRAMDAPDVPLGFGEVEQGGFETGGPSPFAGEMAQFRWVQMQETVNLIRAGADPTVWPGGRLEFPLEAAMAWGHEGLRDRAQMWTTSRAAVDFGTDLYPSIADVAASQAYLDAADEQLQRVTTMRERHFAELEDDPIEVGRYVALSSERVRFWKYALAFVFVVAEFALTSIVFGESFSGGFEGAQFLLAAGVMVGLMAVPHFVAKGLKDGLTSYHENVEPDEDETSKRKRDEAQRRQETERRDDQGFRVASTVLGIMLLIFAIPLSILRLEGAKSGNKAVWFAFFLVAQLLISGYFFLREWYDHGHLSALCHRLDASLEAASEDRTNALGAYAAAIGAYHAVAAPVFTTLLNAARVDSYIVANMMESLEFGRHEHTIGRPELGVFIAGATKPYVGARGEAPVPFRSIYEAQMSLEADNPSGRRWYLDAVATAVAEAEERVVRAGDGANESEPRSASGALLDSMARAFLYDYLWEHFGLRPYVAPEFDVVAAETVGGEYASPPNTGGPQADDGGGSAVGGAGPQHFVGDLTVPSSLEGIDPDGLLVQVNGGSPEGPTPQGLDAVADGGRGEGVADDDRADARS